MYLRAGAATPGVAPFTTDADIALDPALLVAKEPTLEAAMESAGFRLGADDAGRRQPGVWNRTVRVAGEEIVVPVDLIVPEGTVPRSSRRGARLGPHGKRAARKIRGLEGVVVDNSVLTVVPFGDTDLAAIDVRVAGPTALIVAKTHKLIDRLRDEHRPDRVHDKDAADAYRLMQALRAEEAVPVLRDLLEDPRSAVITGEALDALPELFGSRRSVGVAMAQRALRRGVPEARVEVVCTTFTRSVGAEVRP